MSPLTARHQARLPTAPATAAHSRHWASACRRPLPSSGCCCCSCTGAAAAAADRHLLLCYRCAAAWGGGSSICPSFCSRCWVLPACSTCQRRPPIPSSSTSPGPHRCLVRPRCPPRPRPGHAQPRQTPVQPIQQHTGLADGLAADVATPLTRPRLRQLDDSAIGCSGRAAGAGLAGRQAQLLCGADEVDYCPRPGRLHGTHPGQRYQPWLVLPMVFQSAVFITQQRTSVST